MAKPRKKKTISLAHVATGAKMLKIGLVEVDDPFALKPGQKIIVPRNLTPLSDLHSRDKIDEAQKRAGEKFADMYERAELGGAQAIDYTREHVDGGPTPEPLSEQQQEALDWLRRVGRYPGIGKEGFEVLRAVCGFGRPVSDYAKQLGRRRGLSYGIAGRMRAEEGYALIRLCEALDCLVEMLDYKARGNNRGRIAGISGDNLAGLGGEYEIDHLGDVVLKKRA